MPPGATLQIKKLNSLNIFSGYVIFFVECRHILIGHGRDRPKRVKPDANKIIVGPNFTSSYTRRDKYYRIMPMILP